MKKMVVITKMKKKVIQLPNIEIFDFNESL
jgi:hypothetical protein